MLLLLLNRDGNYLKAKRYLTNENLFNSPVESRKVGIYKVSNLCNDIATIKVTFFVKKCVLLPYKNEFVACELLH